jgi:hypothetical protein
VLSIRRYALAYNGQSRLVASRPVLSTSPGTSGCVQCNKRKTATFEKKEFANSEKMQTALLISQTLLEKM